MSYNVKQLPITEDKQNAWKNKMAAAVNSSNVMPGAGMHMSYGPHGATLNVDEIEKQPALVYSGDYDFNQSYRPNQIVRVRYDSVYTNQNGAVIPIGNTSVVSTGSITPISIGLFVCVSYVPPSTCNELFLQTYIIPNFPFGKVPIEAIINTRFYNYNVYYPIFPEIPTQYTASVVTTNGYGIVANQTYWHSLPLGVIPTKICVDDADGTGTKDVFVLGYISGSVFLPQFLPYTAA